MDPEVALQDKVDLTHAGDKEAQKFAPRENDYDPTSDHAKGSSGEKVSSSLQIAAPAIFFSFNYMLRQLCLSRRFS